MGCGSSTPETSHGKPIAAAAPAAQVQELKKSKVIDNSIQDAQQADDHKVKLLLLGPGESGKSTIFKQMRILYGAQRSEDEIRMYGVVVRSNVIIAMRKLITHMQTLELEDKLSEEQAEGDQMSCKRAFDLLIKFIIEGDCSYDDPELMLPDEGDWVGKSKKAGIGPNNDAKLFLRIWKAIKIVWESPQMKDVWEKRSEVNVIDSHKEFLEDIPRIADTTFKPTTHDILLARLKSTEVIMEKYKIDGIQFEMYDVGGQRSERRRWFGCFDNVDAVIFVAALSEYDQNCTESRRTNRMSEALELFRSISNNRSFHQKSVLLFLNKKDIFAEKIMYSKIADQPNFSDYDGPPQDFNAGVMYFMQKFKDCLVDDDFNESFIHVTCATDTSNMEFVLNSTRTIIMSHNLKNSGFLGSY